MKRFRWWLLAVLALTLTGPLHAQNVNLPTAGLPALFGQETPTTPSFMGLFFNVYDQDPNARMKKLLEHSEDLRQIRAEWHRFWINDQPVQRVEKASTPAKPCLEIELSLDCCEGNWLSALVQDCLQVWRQLWNRGDYREAELLAEKAVRIEPTNVEAQHALVVAQIVNAAAKSCPKQNVTWTIVSEELAAFIGGSTNGSTDRIRGSMASGCIIASPLIPADATQAAGCAVSVFAEQQLRQAFGLEECEPPCVCVTSVPKAIAKGCACTQRAACPCVTSSCCCAQTANACPCVTQACSCAAAAPKACACCPCAKRTVMTAPVFEVRPPAPVWTPHYVVQPNPTPYPVVAQPVPVMPPAEAPPPAAIYQRVTVPPPAMPANRFVPSRLPPPPPGTHYVITDQTYMQPDPFRPPTKVTRYMVTAEVLDGEQYSAVPVPRTPVVMYQPVAVAPPATPVSRVVPTAPQRVRLETAHFEAQCGKMTCVGGGDVVLLEGNVEMQVRRQTGPFRVQAQRVRVYLNDGTFVVEGAQGFVAPPPPSTMTVPVRPVRRIVIPPTVPPTHYEEAFPSSVGPGPLPR